MKQAKIIIRRFFRALRGLKNFITSGGSTYVNISQINHGEMLAGKTVLITGGSAGIGLAIAKKCISEGALVIITGRSLDKIERACKVVGHENLKGMVWDVSIVSQIEEKLHEAMSLSPGGVDILVNNAGVRVASNLPDVTEDEWNTIHATNEKGLFFLTQSVAKYWIGSKEKGKILNVASSGGFLGAPGPYRMSKWSIVGLTRGLGLSLLRHGIIVNGIAPGMTSSDMIKIDASENAYVSYYPPSHRVALPEEIAEIAVFLMSSAANYIVGQTIICDGGYSLKN